MKAPLIAAALLLMPAQALAWGSSGHRMVGESAMQALPGEVPAFLRNAQAVRDVGELSREPDRSKGAGRIHDHNRDAAHFLDLDEDGKILGGPSFLPLPPTRADYEKGLQTAGLDSWKAGYLPYAIIEQHQQLTKDFGYWRVLSYMAAREKDRVRKAWYVRDLARREALILGAIGELSHYVGDGAQPLHVTVHYNGWGEFPNPEGFTRARIHGPFEGDIVFAGVKPADVSSKMTPLKSCDCPIEQRTVDYLGETATQVIPLYRLEKAGGLASGDPRGAAFAAERLAVGASELRDMIVSAWRASPRATVGWPALRVEDVLAGKADPYDSLYGRD
ncbi:MULTISPECIES: phospholipase C/P1 nuclease family protein [Phenylobacterium]|uniref:S1/P1 Nuclease n=1 Tax=Phenylobacterium koreense TaxID=266125 RepID=A0ABV2EDF5_9CAUL